MSQFRQGLFKTAPSYFSLTKKLSTGDELVATLKPSSIVFTPGITESVRTTSDSAGNIVEAIRFVSSEIPAITVQFPGADINVIEYKTGKLFVRRDGNSLYGGQDFLSRSNTFAGAPTADLIGNGIAANVAGARASIFRNNENIQLTYATDFASFNPAIPDTFAIGANGARVYSTNLLTEQATVNFSIPIAFTDRQSLSIETLPIFSVAVGLVTIEGQVAVLRANNVQPILEGDLDFSADAVPVTWRVNGDGCQSYSIEYLEQTVFCS